tara:strand:- start:1412 stop:1621 length:210 start_codon:yes stop_codon:yes gene_type:complete
MLHFRRNALLALCASSKTNSTTLHPFERCSALRLPPTADQFPAEDLPSASPAADPALVRGFAPQTLPCP